ncbi:AAA family ATPase [Actinomadura kijaniata]|uniref:Putative ATPase n=1 Tax=Actinomadura namibiensis TaxID=182080 RepID=A0A7W3LKP0_ACTNM|nr:AAA family ATPase [Actinomadura namibiensis]MBA8949906.1 putative ATPase [Actinomadura namibiensis]
MFLERVRVPDELVPPADRARWPFTVPCVADLFGEGLEFTRPVTFLVGENGSGKSTLVEAIADAFGLDSRGGRAGRKYAGTTPLTPLGEVLHTDLTVRGARMLGGPRNRRKGFFLRAETALELAEKVSGLPGYWTEDVLTQSHGEGFLTIFEAMLREPGLYLLDEPESALSFTASLGLVSLMHELGGSGAQVICATHSPVLAATPGADIVEIGPHGARRVGWDELDLVDHHRRFLGDPDAYLRRVL